jgi:hypothetical protein
MSGSHFPLSVSDPSCSDCCTLDVAAAFIAVLLLIMTFVYAWMVLRNFGRGLKDQSTLTRTFLLDLLNLNLNLFSSLSETGSYWRKAQRVPVVVCATQPDEHRLSTRLPPT